jgi:hypothetical protein
MVMVSPAHALTAFDARPVFARALRHGVQHGLIAADRLAAIEDEFAKGIVQIANYFGTAHLRPNLELAAQRMIRLVSLFLEEQSAGDVQVAASLLRDRTLLSLSKGGSEMLKRLHAMPRSIVAGGETEESQHAFLDQQTAGAPLTLADYEKEIAFRRDVQLQIGFLDWLARKLGATSKDARDDADGMVHSAMLVLFVDGAELKFPTPSGFVRLVAAARRTRSKLDGKRLDAFLMEAPDDYRRMTHAAMQRFVTDVLPFIRRAGMSADALLNAESPFYFYTRVDIDDSGKEYTRLVAREWARVTRGEDDNPAVLASIFLFVATGFPAKALMLQREARAVIETFRARGFDDQAVLDYIDTHAPEATRADLRRCWEDDLRVEAEGRLADDDPTMPDTHMARALDYLRTTCHTTWKKAVR